MQTQIVFSSKATKKELQWGSLPHDFAWFSVQYQNVRNYHVPTGGWVLNDGWWGAEQGVYLWKQSKLKLFQTCQQPDPALWWMENSNPPVGGSPRAPDQSNNQSINQPVNQSIKQKINCWRPDFAKPKFGGSGKLLLYS